ncbi:MAG: hypothetical protein ACRDG3_12645 [Tepidiformaceae bacterium]
MSFLASRAMVPAAALCVAIVVLTAACGGSNGGNKTLAQAATVAAQTPAGANSATATVAGFGPAPAMTANITSIAPHHGSSVAQAATRSPNPKYPGGACAQVSFADPVQDVRWFHVSLDGVEITGTPDFAALIHTDGTTGQVCDAPLDGFNPGRHTVRIFILDPDHMAAQPLQSVAWTFDVAA